MFGAISTHYDEEVFCGKIHLELKKKHKNKISIIVPRHVNRVDKIKYDLENNGLKVHLHSSKLKLQKNTDIYLVDTYGETKLFLDLCKIVYLGGSIIKRGGQNPLEPARECNYIIYGPNIDNFKEVYEMLKKLRIASKVKTIKKMKDIVLKKINYKQKKIVNKKLYNEGIKILNKNFIEINKYI